MTSHLSLSRALRLLAAISAIACSNTPESSAAQATKSFTPTQIQISQSRRTAITDAVMKVAPAVVTVQTEVVDNAPSDPFAMFFGRAQPRTQSGLGTGFVVRSDGVIVTNAHVVAGASKTSVMMRDGTTYPAKVLGADETNDLAVLKIDAKNLPVAKLGRSDDLLIGEWAIAIGNPYGFLLGNSEPSVSAGVISGTGRNLTAQGEGAASYFDMIQTDAAINPGNSGGPLVNADGDVIGVNSNIYSNSGGSVGIGFAIPINRASRVVEDLLTHGSIRRPWIGVRLRGVSSDNPRDALTGGAVVASITPNSPAEQAGLKPGDVIVREGNRVVRNQFDWEAALLDLRVGEPAKVRVHRGSSDIDMTVDIADMPEVNAHKVQVLRELELVTVTPAIRAERNLATSSGALVFNVTPRIADEIGIQKGDVIVGINGVQIRTADDAARRLDYLAGRASIGVVFERQRRRYQTVFYIR
jgi:serine protease Do